MTTIKVEEIIRYPIVMTSMSRHDHLSSASLSLAKELSKDQDVYYINYPFSVKNGRKKPVTKEVFAYSDEYPNLKIIETGKVFPINFLPDNRIYDFFSRLNNSAFNRAINFLFNSQHIDPEKFIFFNSFNPLFGRFLPKKFKPLINIYQSRDDIASAPYVYKHGVRLEIEAIKRADIAYATSSKLSSKLSALANKEVIHLPNAANISLFNSGFSKQSPDSNIIGYIGEVETRVDLDLLKSVADSFPNHIVLVVGPCWESIIEEFRTKCPNVVFAGFRKMEALPSLLKSFKVSIIPFKVNELTKHIYPLKINEYLAAGTPVVSTDFSVDLSEYHRVVYLSGSHEEFVKNINKAIEEDNEDLRNRRNQFSQDKNWMDRVKTLRNSWIRFLNEQ